MCDGMPLVPFDLIETGHGLRPAQYLVTATKVTNVPYGGTFTSVMYAKVCQSITDVKEIQRGAHGKGYETTVFGWNERKQESFELNNEQFLELNSNS